MSTRQHTAEQKKTQLWTDLHMKKWELFASLCWYAGVTDSISCLQTYFHDLWNLFCPTHQPQEACPQFSATFPQAIEPDT